MKLSRSPVILRLMVLFLMCSVLFSLGLVVFLGVWGIFAGSVLAYLFLNWAAFYSERAMIRYLCAEIEPSMALINSFHMVLKDFRREEGGYGEFPIPRLLIIQDPLPKALNVRGLTGSGTILLSTGLLAQFHESELRAVLRACFLRLQQSEWIFYSLCSYLLVMLLRVTPRFWVEFFFSKRPIHGSCGPFSVVRLIVLLPWVQFLLLLGRPRSTPENSDPAWSGATSQLRSTFKKEGYLECPAASMLYLGNSVGENWIHPFFLPLS